MSLETSLELNVILDQIDKLCSFSLGKQRIQNTKPTYDPLVIRRENAYIKEALAVTVKYGPMPFHGMSDLTVMLQNAEKGRTLTNQDFMDEIRFISGVRDIINYEKSCEDLPRESLKDLTDTLIVHTQVEKHLQNVFNEYGEIRDSASPALKGIRSSLRAIDGQIANVANAFIREHANSVVDGIITYRFDRAVILVKASQKNMFGGMQYGDSASGQATYIEPRALVEVNNQKQEYKQKEIEEEHRILKECSKLVQSIAKEELSNLETCAILDSIFAKAIWGKEKDATVATLSEQGDFMIREARHPLIDPKKVVSNSYHIQSPHRILLITGPNTGGKTVSMKIIGLFVLMTYAGIPVPCEDATIPYFDRIFVDIGDDQSVVSSLSSFSAHMTKQAEVLREATSQSLVLLDEVGSGTDPREGEALAISILNELRNRKTMAVVTTHYDRLKTYGKRHDDILLASVQFDMDELVPTYKYIEGLTGQSNAFEVAKRYGLPSGVIKYARSLKNQAKSREDELIEQLEKQLNENVILKEQYEKQLEEVEQKEKQLKQQLHQLQVDKDKILIEAKKEADIYLDNVEKRAKKILKDIRKRQEDAKFHEALDSIQEINQMHALSQIEEDSVDDSHEYHVGDAVELRGSNQVCQIVSIKRKDITILLNDREVHVKKNQIRPSMHIIPKMKKQNNVSIHTQSNIFSAMPIEVNLIGLRVDEAMEKLDAYMDQAKLHRLHTYRVIHGDGSGRLRAAVHEKLKKDKTVKEFRLGMPQEGGTGATVVVMK